MGWGKTKQKTTTKKAETCLDIVKAGLPDRWKINKFRWIWKKSKCLVALKKVIIQRCPRKSHFKDAFNKATLVKI